MLYFSNNPVQYHCIVALNKQKKKGIRNHLNFGIQNALSLKGLMSDKVKSINMLLFHFTGKCKLQKISMQQMQTAKIITFRFKQPNMSPTV